MSPLAPDETARHRRIFNLRNLLCLQIWFVLGHPDCYLGNIGSFVFHHHVQLSQSILGSVCVEHFLQLNIYALHTAFQTFVSHLLHCTKRISFHTCLQNPFNAGFRPLSRSDMKRNGGLTTPSAVSALPYCWSQMIRHTLLSLEAPCLSVLIYLPEDIMNTIWKISLHPVSTDSTHRVPLYLHFRYAASNSTSMMMPGKNTNWLQVSTRRPSLPNHRTRIKIFHPLQKENDHLEVFHDRIPISCVCMAWTLSAVWDEIFILKFITAVKLISAGFWDTCFVQTTWPITPLLLPLSPLDVGWSVQNLLLDVIDTSKGLLESAWTGDKERMPRQQYF